jgi:hypothetical protein
MTTKSTTEAAPECPAKSAASVMADVRTEAAAPHSSAETAKSDRKAG